jgi:hypothetical protein
MAERPRLGIGTLKALFASAAVVLSHEMSI